MGGQRARCHFLPGHMAAALGLGGPEYLHISSSTLHHFTTSPLHHLHSQPTSTPPKPPQHASAEIAFSWMEANLSHHGRSAALILRSLARCCRLLAIYFRASSFFLFPVFSRRPALPSCRFFPGLWWSPCGVSAGLHNLAWHGGIHSIARHDMT